MTISVIQGAEAKALMRDSQFRKKWLDLTANCPWATAFQSFGFVHTWYRSYWDQFEPALVYQLSPVGDFLGLLPLAIQREGGDWVVAGDHQCEYQMWLALPQYGESFISLALKHLFEECRIDHLHMTFVLTNAPLNWARSGPLQKRCLLKPRLRPVMVLEDGHKLKASLKKKSNKSRLNRLKKLGPVRFERITSRSRLAELLPELETLYDFRLEAVYSVSPFRNDTHKREFHLALMDVPDLLHVTLLKAGDRIVAFHIGVCDQNTVYNGILAYSPFEARQSPAKLHTLLLGKDMVENGFSRFDLTPGRDLWKKRFGDHCETVYAVTVFSDVWKRRLGRAKQGAEELTLRILETLGVDHHSLHRTLRAVCHRPLDLVVFAVRKVMSRDRPAITFQIPVAAAKNVITGNSLNRDCLLDLLAERSERMAGPADGFLLEALKRIESGQHFYTSVSGGRLVFCGWLTAGKGLVQPAAKASAGRNTTKTVLIQNFSTEGSTPSTESLEAAVGQMIQDAASTPGVEEIFVLIPGNNPIWQAVIDNLGSKYPGLINRV